jgi:non-ribosomal peptide synthetase component F
LPVSPDHNAVAIDLGEFTWSQLMQRAQELADAHGIKPGQSYGLHGSSDLITTIALQVVLPVAFGHSVVLIDQANPDLDVIKKQEKLEQILLLE